MAWNRYSLDYINNADNHVNWQGVGSLISMPAYSFGMMGFAVYFNPVAYVHLDGEEA